MEGDCERCHFSPAALLSALTTTHSNTHTIIKKLWYGWQRLHHRGWAERGEQTEQEDDWCV